METQKVRNHIGFMRKAERMKPLVWLAILSFCGSCVREEIEVSTSSTGSEYEVHFTIRFSEHSSATRALNETDENEVKEIQVLAFEPDKGNFSYMSYAKKIGTPSGTDEEKYVTKLRSGNYDLMLLVNANEYIDASFPDKIAKGTSRTTVITSLQMMLTDKWVTTSGTTYRPIPMWGMKENVSVSKSTDLSGENSFDVTRALAKINVLVDLEEGHVGTFELTSVMYYNRRTKGQLIPNNWDATATYVQEPSLVTGDEAAKTALRYDGNEITENKNCINEIYVLEAPRGSRDDHPAYPCLVIGGKYNDTSGYYRIDFAYREGETDTYTPILRNHTYSVIITKVDGEGFTDPDDAYNSLPVNVTADIIDWNPQAIGDIYFDGQHYLSIEKGRYEFSWKALTRATFENLVKIKTDYPGGWKYIGVEYDNNERDWLTFVGGDKGGQNEDSERWISLYANSTKQVRTATITIAVGRIRGKIIVTQEPAPDAQLIIRDKDGNIVNNDAVITYQSDNWDIQECEYTLEWAPANALITVGLRNLNTTGYSPMEFADDSNMLRNGEVITFPTGEYTFGFSIAPFDTSVLKQKGETNLSIKSGIHYTFTLGEGQGAINQNFTVVNELLDVQATKLGGCKQGRLYGFEVTYNTPWELYLDGQYKILDSRTLSDLPSEGGIDGQTGKRTIYFRMEVEKDYDGEQVAFSFVKPGTGKTNMFDKVNVESHYNYPNSYMVGTNSSFSFEVIKAYYMWESNHIGKPLGKGELGLKVLWADQLVLSSIHLEENTEFPERSLIKGSTSGITGNALVALTLDDEVVWSWHIWVVDYSPDESPKYYYNSGIITTLMDRNLGAWHGGLGDERAYGLYYQWGRKDPFPGPSAVNGRGEIGNGGNVGLQIDDRNYYVEAREAPSSDNLIESIRNPHLFYLSSTFPYDWYTHNTANQNSALWHDSDQLKSDFDPCPDGWRTGSCFRVNKQYYYTWAFIPYGESEYGWNYAGYLNIGMYPRAGYLRGDNGHYDLTKEECWLWYGTYSNQDTGGLVEGHESLIDRTFVNAKPESVRAREGSNRANGVPIRCERDEKNYWYQD